VLFLFLVSRIAVYGLLLSNYWAEGLVPDADAPVLTD
jgi:hypothetical protein